MGMTIVEKIFAHAAGRSSCRPGEILTVDIDAIMTQDATWGMTYRLWDELDMPVWDPSKVFVFVDHYCPAGTTLRAELAHRSAEFCEKSHIENFYNLQGVSHQIMCETGKVKPGSIMVGGDSHTVTYGAFGAFATGIGSSEVCSVLATGKLWFKVPETIKVQIDGKLPPHVTSKDIILKLLSLIGANGATYKALEFCGEAIDNLSMESRITISNMTVEGGAKCGIIAVDDTTRAYLYEHGVDESEILAFYPDEDAEYADVIHMDVSDLAPQVAVPYSPANGKPVEEVAGVPLHQVMIGACTNGKIEDLKIAADILKGKYVAKGVKCYVIPASNKVYAEAARRGYLEIFAEAGCIVMNPGCGGCGIPIPLIDNENCIATNNRNFCGRMGSAKAHVYVASPVTAAVSALTGEITDPREYFKVNGGTEV